MMEETRVRTFSGGSGSVPRPHVPVRLSMRPFSGGLGASPIFNTGETDTQMVSSGSKSS